MMKPLWNSHVCLHTFSALRLRSSVVSVLVSLISDFRLRPNDINWIFVWPEETPTCIWSRTTSRSAKPFHIDMYIIQKLQPTKLLHCEIVEHNFTSKDVLYTESVFEYISPLMFAKGLFSRLGDFLWLLSAWGCDERIRRQTMKAYNPKFLGARFIPPFYRISKNEPYLRCARCAQM